MRDCDIRTKLKYSLLNKYYLDKNSRVVNEMTVGYGEAIVDIAVINGSLHGYEIKSEFDTLSRLPNQLSAYTKTFDYLTIICSEKHLQRLAALVPQWCGIIIIDSQDNVDRKNLKYFQRPRKNIYTDKYSIAQLLWRDETIAVLNEIGINKGINSKSKPLLWQLLADSIDKKKLSEKVREKLKLRAKWKSDELPFGNDDYFLLSAT